MAAIWDLEDSWLKKIRVEKIENYVPDDTIELLNSTEFLH